MEHRSVISVAVIAGLFFVAGQYVASQPQRTQQEIEANREITVTGQGEVSYRPDIASITLGVDTGPQKTAEAALDILGKRFDAVVGAVKAKGVSEDDITTSNLSIQPQYDFSEGRQTLRGFSATESIRVKIRKLDAVGEVIAAATAQGVNQAGGISFEVDDSSDLQTQAEEQAIKDANTKAERLANALGANLGNVKSFSASSGTPDGPIYARAELATEDKISTPPVPAGTQDISTTVTITYELK